MYRVHLHQLSLRSRYRFEHGGASSEMGRKKRKEAAIRDSDRLGTGPESHFGNPSPVVCSSFPSSESLSPGKLPDSRIQPTMHEYVLTAIPVEITELCSAASRLFSVL